MFLPRTWLICRVCMKQSDGMVNLFSHISEQPVWNLLRDCGGIPVRKNDQLPDKICEACLQRLWKAHAFRLDCQRAHRDITHIVQPKFLNEEEFLSDREPEKPSLVDKYLANVIDKFEAEKNNGYLGSSDSNDSISKAESNSAITSILNKPHAKNNSNEEEFVDEAHKCYPMVNIIINKTDDTQLNTRVHPKKKRTKLSSARPKRKRLVLSFKSSKWSTISKRTNTKGVITRSKNKQRPQLAYGCRVCKNVYASRELLRHHMYTHIKPHDCKICGKMFSQKQQFTNHMNSHSGLQPYSCRMCSRTFSDTSNRNKHEKNIHNRKCISKCRRTRKCFICDKTFLSVAGLRCHHRRIHLKSLVAPEENREQ